MIPELGHYALILALFAALAQMHPLLCRRAAFLQFALILMVFLALMWSYLTSDFTVANVVANSHTLKPVLYKIAGLWGNHEGSMMLWVLMLSLFGALVALKTPAQKVLRVMGALGTGFIAYTLFVSNPFMRVYPPPYDGDGLNPVLQDPALALHPPMLYMGYVGFSVAFAFAVAALWEGKTNKKWAAMVRPWIMLAWTALSTGIALGSFWAYYELGWGGWWFWDPVENASLMPWLLGTALLHSIIVLEKRGALQRWCLLLCILTFSLSILGTFLVRSGVLTSVHAFAVDPRRGIFILALLVIFTGGSLFLYARRALNFKDGQTFAPLSRESALVFNNLFLSTMAATVLIGTLYPMILSALDAGQISVGPPYFHGTFIPLAVPLLLLAGIGPFLPWKKSGFSAVLKKIRFIAAVTLGLAALIAMLSHNTPLFSFLGMGLGLWIIISTLTETRQRFKRLFPLSQWGITLSHIGLGIAVIGMTGTGLWMQENTAVLKNNQKMTVGAYEFTLEKVIPAFGPNYNAIRAQVTVHDTRNNQTFALYPEQRYYPVSGKNTNEAAIRLRPAGDIYVVLSGHDKSGKSEGWIIAAKTHPLVGFLWLGFFLIISGGMLMLSARVKWPQK